MLFQKVIFTFSCKDIDMHSIYTVYQCTTADVRVFKEMLQESYPPARAILEGYIPL
jgi:hypothetical protein